MSLATNLNLLGSDDQLRVRWGMHDLQYRAFAAQEKYTVLVCGRRGGKSETLVRRLTKWVGDARRDPGTSVFWVVLPSYPLARPLYRKFLQTLPEPWISQEYGTVNRPDTLIVDDRIRIEFKSADNAQSLVAEGLKGLVIDEAGIMKEIAWTESLLPTLIDHDAPAILAGTPKGKNWFHRMFVRGQDAQDERVASFHWPSWANPYVPLRSIQELARDMSERMFRQEILAEFLEDDGAVFRGVRNIIAPLSEERTAVIGIDLAKLQDFTVLHGLDKRGNTTFFERFNTISWPVQKQRIIAAQKRHGGTIVLDSTGVGDPIKDDLIAAGMPLIPFKFTSVSKGQLVERLALAIEQRAITLPDEPILLNELEIYEYEVSRAGHTRYSAPEGLHDDTVMALGLAVWGLGKQVPDIASVHW